MQEIDLEAKAKEASDQKAARQKAADERWQMTVTAKRFADKQRYSGNGQKKKRNAANKARRKLAIRALKKTVKRRLTAEEVGAALA